MSSRRENYQARGKDPANGNEWLRQAIVFLLPIADFKRNRAALVETYAHIYHDVEVARERMSSMSNEEIRMQARHAALYATNYDPHPLNSLVSKMCSWIATFWTVLSWVFILIGTALSIRQLVVIGQDLQQFPEIVMGLVPPVLLAIIGLLMYFLRADTVLHQILNRELRVIGGRLSTRNRSKLVGYKIWNDSLHGQSGLVMLTCLYLLESLCFLPLVGSFFSNPREFVLETVRQNAETLYHSDGTIETIKNIYPDVRTRL